MFVFGEVQDPLLETVKLVEDIVRGQIVEIITRARQLTHLRASRFLSADDVIFLIRDDRGKVNRLRTYLSWKDVRKKAKDDESGEAGAEVEIDDAVNADSFTEKMTAKIRNTMVKLPWEVLTPFSDALKSLPGRHTRAAAAEEDEEQDEDEMQAYQDSMQRLRDADEITKKMTKDEYVHYSDCRQASFTYRKAKRFREFVNFSAYLDVGPNDDIVDILGFLSFEMVRTLCVKSLDVRDRMERSVKVASAASGGAVRRNTMLGGKMAAGGIGNGGGAGTKRKSLSVSRDNEPASTAAEPSKRAAVPAAVLTTQGSETTAAAPVAPAPVSLFAPPPSARQPLLPMHVLEAFAQIQREQVGGRVGGMRNFRGGVMRGTLALI
ncbi:transcription cofactor [Dioszegia hungarica]|uniref:Transcription cofactor n=1 Tax=Dioszegia hungarica TaxID=4972 RepID=A0AA38LT53_9TREE|nr:transcription cofactor [Dioszegia hungarica]KAI9634318.1 transcription cofactor [Dioszegia hungarica]